MEPKRVTHFIYVPFTGLGLYNGYRGDRWLKNRIQVFKQFVVPSIKRLWKDNMVLWVSWRVEEYSNPLVKQLELYLQYEGFRIQFTYHGICFWDDKYPDEEASYRLKDSLRNTVPYLRHLCAESDEIWMTIQPSDDIYLEFPSGNEGWSQGYIMNYATGEIAHYNPTTTPPFYTISFTKEQFLNPVLHYRHTGPYKSHEYVKDFLPMSYAGGRRFIVGTHGENISTGFDIPFRGMMLTPMESWSVREAAGIKCSGRLEIDRGWRRTLWFRLPHRVRRKIRYWLGERFYARIHKHVTNH